MSGRFRYWEYPRLAHGNPLKAWARIHSRATHSAGTISTVPRGHRRRLQVQPAANTPTYTPTATPSATRPHASPPAAAPTPPTPAIPHYTTGRSARAEARPAGRENPLQASWVTSGATGTPVR